jgi:formate hydrogenlyase subunit 4
MTSALLIPLNLLLFLLLAPLFDGVVRRVTARIQSRKGPPLIQPYYDLFKLLGKDNLSPGNWAFHLAPIMALASVMAAIALTPFAFRAHYLAQHHDIVTLIYLLTLGGVSVLLGALASRNIFASIGASREMVTMIMVEPILAMTLIFNAVKVQSLGIAPVFSGVAEQGYAWSVVLMLVLYLAALQAFVGRQPFDLAEAESEIVEGPFIEYSGPNYALFKLYMMLKQMFYAALFVTIFLPFLRTGYLLLDLPALLVGVSIVFLLIALVGATNPRLRIDQAVRYYAGLGVGAILAVTLSVYGW